MLDNMQNWCWFILLNSIEDISVLLNFVNRLKQFVSLYYSTLCSFALYDFNPCSLIISIAISNIFFKIPPFSVPQSETYYIFLHVHVPVVELITTPWFSAAGTGGYALTHGHTHARTHSPNLNNDPSYESTSSSGPHQSLCCGKKTDPRIGC